MNRQWEDVENAIKEGRMNDAGVAIAEITTELNDDALDSKLDYNDIEEMTNAIYDNFI